MRLAPVPLTSIADQNKLWSNEVCCSCFGRGFLLALNRSWEAGIQLLVFRPLLSIAAAASHCCWLKYLSWQQAPLISLAETSQASYSGLRLNFVLQW